MHVEIKTKTVTQLRNTFSHVARRIGGDKPASRYQEATFDLQPTANFHYRPLWQPDMEIYDVRRTRLAMNDWYLLRDPRQYYYGTYTITRARQQETMEKNIDFIEKRGLLRDLPDSIQDELIFALVPLRHVEWGANTNNCYITAYAWGTAITQATMFHTMDRLALAQYISRIGLLLDDNTGESLKSGKAFWMEHAAWQPLRRLVERSMATKDWFELFVAQNLVIDGLIHPLVFRRFQARVEERIGPALALLTEFMVVWYDESARWVDAVIKTAAMESAANSALLGGWIDKWQPAVLEALTPYSKAIFGADSEAVLADVLSGLQARIGKLGVKIGEQTS